MARRTTAAPEPFDRELADLPADLRWREWMGRVEAAIFASPTPVPREILTGLVGRTCALEDVIADIQDELRARPYELVFVAGGWHHRTRPRFADAIRTSAVAEGRPAPDLSSTDLAVLAAIAYLQPLTRGELSQVFGIEINRDRIARLREADLVASGPRSPLPGAPATYVTTPAFLSTFGLGSLRDLPEIEALQDAGLLDESSPLDHPGEALAISDRDREDDHDEVDLTLWPEQPRASAASGLGRSRS
jgi:chromosome segregation and condensation protein ScpB